MKLICYVEEHRSICGRIISRLDNGAFVVLIYKLLVFSYFHVEVVPTVKTTPRTHQAIQAKLANQYIKRDGNGMA